MCKKFNRVVFDIEANGLLNTISKVWCIVIKDLSTGTRETFSNYSKQKHVQPLDKGLNIISKASMAVCHNVILYDALALRKLYPKYDFSKVKWMDSLILSQLQNFNRPLRFSWGKHGLEAWGLHFSRHKPAQAQWTVFEEAMINRCEEDVEINYLAYRYLLDENKEIGIDRSIVAREMRTAVVSQQQVINGWRFDKELAKKHLKALDTEMLKLKMVIEPMLPMRVLKPSQAATWEDVNVALGYKFRRVPQTKTDHLGNIVKPAKLPTIPKITRAGNYHSAVAKWFNIEPSNAKKTKVVEGKSYNASLVDGPFTKVNWEVSRMSQHAQVKKFLFTQGWVPTTWNFKKDANGNFLKDSVGRKIKTTPKLTEDSFDSIKGALGKQIATYNTFSSRRKVIANADDPTKGWLNNLTPEGRLVCIPRTIGAATARMTHEGIVNVPGTKALFGKEMRQLFIASEGFQIVACDMASAQLRLLAAAMGDPNYIQAVVTGSEEDAHGNYIGTDIHSINGIAAGLIDPSWTPGGKRWKAGRSNAKTFIYGLLFGAGDAKIGTIINGTAEHGARLRQKFLSTLPSLKDLINRLTIEWKANKKKYKAGWFSGLDGRRIYCSSSHKLLNYKLQSDEAILLKQWMINVDNAIKDSNKVNNARLLLSYHDELNYETIPDETKALGVILKEGIQQAGTQLGINIMDGDYKVGINWAEVH